MRSRGKGTVRQTMMGAQRTKAGNGLSPPISHHHLYPYLLLWGVTQKLNLQLLNAWLHL